MISITQSSDELSTAVLQKSMPCLNNSGKEWGINLGHLAPLVNTPTSGKLCCDVTYVVTKNKMIKAF